MPSPSSAPCLLKPITEHCIDILRSASMCRADTAIFTYHWNDATRLPNPTWMQKHQCLDWESLEEWLESRRIDIYTPNLLVHPKYGEFGATQTLATANKSMNRPCIPRWEADFGARWAQSIPFGSLIQGSLENMVTFK